MRSRKHMLHRLSEHHWQNVQSGHGCFLGVPPFIPHLKSFSIFLIAETMV